MGYLRRRNRGASDGPSLTGMLFAGDTAYALLTGDAFTAGAMQMWIRCALLTKPIGTRTSSLFGNNDFGASGVVIGSEQVPGDTSFGRLYSWSNSNYRVPPLAKASLVVPDEALGKPFTIHAWRDAGGLLHVAIDGQEWWQPVALAMADIGSAVGFAINTRLGAAGSNPYGTLVVYEAGFATSVPSLSDVRAHAAAAPGTTLPNMLELFDGRSVGPNVGKWTGTIASKQLALTGPVSQVRTSGRWGLGIGTIDFWGDSHILGRSGPTGLKDTDGFRRGFFKAVWGSGVSVMHAGFGVNGADDPNDYDAAHSGVGGKGVGVPSSGNSMRTDAAAEMALYCAPSGARLIGTFANDANYRVNTLIQSAAVASAAMLADLGGICGDMRAAGHTGRIWILDCPRPSTTNAPNQAHRDAIDLFNASFMTTVDNARSTHGGEIRGFQLSARTPTFSGAGLDDGTHAAAPLYALWGNDLAAWALGLAR